MVQTAGEVAQEYKLSLEELTSNNKTQINLLTILAEDYKNYAETIVDTIEKQLYTVTRDRKLPMLYVIDSILKNVNSSPDYKLYFEKIIIKIFLHVFVHSDEKQRSALYKLRITWNSMFKPGTLYKLDMSVNSEDSNWPIITPKSIGSGASSTTTPTPATGGAACGQVHVNPKFLANQQGGAARDPRTFPSQTNIRSSGSSTGPTDPRQQPKSVIQAKSEPMEQDKPTSVLDIVLGPVKSVKEEPEEPVPSMIKKASPTKRKTDEAFKGDRKRAREEKPKDEDLRAIKPVKPKRVSRFSPAHPTNAPFPSGMPSSTVAAPATGTVVPGPMFNPAVNLSPPPQFSPSYPNVPHSRPVPGIGFIPPVPDVSSQQYFAPPIEPVNKAIIHHETGPKLELPANNRIFVDGRAHEVFYIGETAVIERNGLPHRIYFDGPPRNVIVDGIAYLLHFGERKTIYIDGQPHVLRFGSPSKELYMGNYAFKGQFGGAPIIAIIDNVRHEIRLSGPPPEVKIEPGPAYELSKDMHIIRKGEPVAANKPLSESAIELVQRLKRSGLLKLDGKSMEDQKTTKPKDNKPQQTFKPFIPKETTPPRPSEHTFDSVKRQSAPTSTDLHELRKFNMRILKVRYDVFIDALHEKQQNACPQCGMRMELSGEKYKNHLDWHVKRNLQTLDRTSTSRPWFSAGKDWLASDDESMAGTSNANEESNDSNGPVPAVNSDDAENKECMVCGEKFEEYFDEEEDMWRLRNTVMIQDKRVCHVGCMQDASVLETSTTELDEPSSFVSDPSVVEHKPNLNFVTQAQ